MAQKFQVFTVYDKKTAAYEVPFYFHTKAAAIREFKDVVCDGKSKYFRHPEDYCLFYLGEFDDKTGKVEVVQNPQPVEEALLLRDPVEVKKG